MNYLKRTIICAAFIGAAALAVAAGFIVAKHDFPEGARRYAGGLLARYLDPTFIETTTPPTIGSGSCRCRRAWDSCPCESRSFQPSYDFEIWRQLEEIDFGTVINPVPDPMALLRSATGFNRIAPTPAKGGGKIKIQRRGGFGKGRLEELMISYDRPRVRVRALYAKNDRPAKDLFILTTGSWTTAEQMMGLWKEDYYRRIGGYYFDKGFDVLAFDHASNGDTESMMNVTAVVGGGQALGIWARSICDTMDALDLRKKYRRVMLYGLSRGGRVVEFTTALCPGFSFAFVGDVFDPEFYVSSNWAARRFVKETKYGAWFLHLTPFAGWLSGVDVMRIAKSPIIYTVHEDGDWASSSTLKKAFRFRDGLSAAGKRMFLFKTSIIHEPELELIDKLLAGRWSELRGLTLEAR